MSVALLESLPKSRLKALLDHFGQIEDPREPWRVAHPLPEVLLLVVCGTICDCEDYDLIAEWGEEHLAVLRRYLPYHHGVPGGRWLTPLMNRINPGLFAAAFTARVRASWPDRPEFVAIDGKTSRRSHDGSVRARANKYNLCSRTCGDVPSRGFQDGQHRHGPPEVKQLLAVGGNMLVVAGARAEKVAEFVVGPAEPGR